MDPQILSVFEDASLENAQQSTKQIRYLENADLHLENIRVCLVLTKLIFLGVTCFKIRFSTSDESERSNQRLRQVIHRNCFIIFFFRSQDNSLVVAASPTIYIKSFSKVTMRSPMEKVYKSIKEGGILGKTIEEIMVMG